MTAAPANRWLSPATPHGSLRSRASIMILRAARALAAAEERDYVIPDDVKTLAPTSLSHRIIVTADAIMSGRSAEVLVREIVDEVDVPVAGNP